MKRIDPTRLFCLTLLLFCPMFTALSASGQGVAIEADNPYIQYMGRVDFSNPKAPRFDWPGVSILARFTGTRCAVRIGTCGVNMYNVFLDENFISVMKPIKSHAVYEVVDHASKGEHTILITKRTEGMFGVDTFEGFVLDPAAKLLPPPVRPSRRIEFIGDSLTCGFGNEGKDPCSIIREHENNYLAFGPSAARVLNAEFVVIAKSGEGMVKNASDSKAVSEDPMPFYYDRTCENLEEPKWDFSQWIPDVVVIALGANDFTNPPSPTPESYIRGYQVFVQNIRRNYPNAHICCYYPRYFPYIDQYIKNVVESFNTNGDPKVHYVDLDPQVPFVLGNNEMGCLNHPRVTAHQRIAFDLAKKIGQIIGW